MPDESNLHYIPERMALTNIETGDGITAQFNPEEITEKVVVNWNDLEIMGLSHQPKQYKSTKNAQIDFEMGFDAHSVRPVIQSGVAVTDGPAYARRFLLHLCYSRREAQDVQGGAAPRVLFFWPELFSLTAVITSVEFKHKRFIRTGKPVIFTAKVTIEEARVTRLFSEDVLTGGTMRGA
jgi:hypothetical protein